MGGPDMGIQWESKDFKDFLKIYLNLNFYFFFYRQIVLLKKMQKGKVLQ